MKDEDVGKGRPPAASRFKTDRSGNPRGRKKGTKNVKTIVCKVAREQHSV